MFQSISQDYYKKDAQEKKVSRQRESEEAALVLEMRLLETMNLLFSVRLIEHPV